MWPRSDLTELLGIDHPIIQAPMAGAATPALAAAVTNAGGLGSLGCASMPVDSLLDAGKEVRAATNRPFNLNFFAHKPPAPDKARDLAMQEIMRPFYEERGLGDPPAEGLTPFGTFDENQLAAVQELKPPVVSFHFGLPSAQLLDEVRTMGAILLCTATTVDEALALDAAGIDAIIAQGWEAGGHRGTFETSFEDFGVGTMALVPQIVDAVSVPVIAAGGIADGRGIAAAFALGASGVQMGTAFLSCPEAGTGDVHRRVLREARDDDTRLTRAFSGRPARARNSSYIEAMASHRIDFPDFPTMYGFSRSLANSSNEKGDDDFRFLLYGQAAALNRELPAGELVQLLVEEAQGVLNAS